MGTVYKARHLLMDRVVALKVIHPRLLRNPDAVERFRRDTPTGGPAGLHCLDLAAIRSAAAHLLDNLAQRRAHWHFNEPGVGNLTGQRENLCALAFLGADTRKPISSFADNRRNVGESFNVIDKRWTIV